MQIGNIDDVQSLATGQTDVSVTRTDAQTADRLVDLYSHPFVKWVGRLLGHTGDHVSPNSRMSVKSRPERALTGGGNAPQV